MKRTKILVALTSAAALVGGSATVYGRGHNWDLNPLKKQVERGDLMEQKIFRYGKPEPSISYHTYRSHTLAYDRSRRVPVWVMEVLDKDNMNKDTANRKNSKFQPDTSNVPSTYSASNSDYWKSGWSRGHLAAAGNYKHCQESMNDTFYLTNIVPQNMDNNGGYWLKLERYCRRLAEKYNQVYIISGPLYLPEEVEGGKKVIHHEVIGEGEVCVPTHLFKIVMATNVGQPPIIGSFVVPNKPLRDEPLLKYQVPMTFIESKVGTTFLKQLQRHKALDLCEVDGCQLESSRMIRHYSYKRDIKNARKKERLDYLWAGLHEEGFDNDSELKQLYERKLRELEEQRYFTNLDKAESEESLSKLWTDICQQQLETDALQLKYSEKLKEFQTKVS